MKRKLYCEKCFAEYEMNYISVQKLIFNNKRYWECRKCKEKNQNLIKMESLSLFLFFGAPVFPLVAFFRLDSSLIILWMIFLIIIMPWIYDLNFLFKLKNEDKKSVLEGISFFIMTIIFSKRLSEMMSIRETLSSFVIFRGDIVENLAMCFSLFIFLYLFIARRKKTH